jgi:TolB-like protein/Tfp pilus assembly protein PilF
MSFFEELKRRNVIRVVIAYAVTAWLLLQLSDVILGNIEAPGWVFQVIMLVLGIGLPLVIIFAWAFEMTPEGIKREKDVDRSQSITDTTGQKLNRLIIGILAVAVVYLLVDKLVLQKGSEPFSAGETVQLSADSEQKRDPTPDSPSVAVLPFVNMSADPENEYFSDGLTETLLHMLAQLPDLRVAARTSSFAFKGQTTSIAEIAEALNVAHILEGSVQKSGERVRVTAQLIRADDGFHVWSQNYTRPLEDIFAIQDEIAGDVADALGTSLLGGSRSELASVDTRNVSAYDSYLKGLEQQAIFSYSSLDVAENHFKQALARDPDFTDARLSLVRNYLLKFSTGLITEEVTRAAIAPLLQQVRAKDPDNRLARALELTMELQIFSVARSGEETRAIVEELRALLQSIPTETYIRRRVAGMLFGFFNEKQQGVEVLQAGLMIDPLSADLHAQLGDFYTEQGRLDEARIELRRSLELAPDNPNTYADLAGVEMESGNLLGGLEWMRRATEVDPQDHELAAHLAKALYELRLSEEGDRWMARVQALAPGSDLARSMEVHRAMARSEHQAAIELAERAIRDQLGVRQGAFFEVVFGYVDLMTQAGRSQEAYDFLVSVRPEIADFDQMMADPQGLGMRFAGFELLAAIDPPETRKVKWQKFAAQMDAIGFPWLADPADANHTMNYLMLGEPDKAIQHYLEHRLSRPLTLNLTRHERRMSALMGPVYKDPRVKAALDAEAERYAELRIEVQEMLQEPEWQ